MTQFNIPPGWPPVPPGWVPPPGWTPDPSWPPAPDGWEFWRATATPAGPPLATVPRGASSPVTATAYPNPGASGEPMGKPPTRWRWVTPVVAVGALIIGLVIGGAGKGSQDDGLPAAAEPEPAPTVTVTADPTLEQQDALDERSTALDQRSTELDQRQADLDTREAAITVAEQAFDQNNLPPGSYLVGTDVQAGTWKTVGSVTGLCYMGQNNGNDIMWNDVADTGQAIATVENVPGTVFEFNADCGSMAKVG